MERVVPRPPPFPPSPPRPYHFEPTVCRYDFNDLKDLGCFDDDLDDTEKNQSQVLPEPSSFGRQKQDVKLMAARWKANLEACIKLYPHILKLAPGAFSSVKVDLEAHNKNVRLGPDEGKEYGNLQVPTAAAGNASLSAFAQREERVRTTMTTMTAHIINPVDGDGRLHEELKEEEVASDAVSRRSEDQYASAVRTQVLHKDLSCKNVVHFLMHYSMWHARLGEYKKDDEDEVIAHLQELDPKLLLWLNEDISTDDKVRSLLCVSDDEMPDLAPSGVRRQTGSGIDKARLKQQSYLKEQTGVAPNGLTVSRPATSEAMEYESAHKNDGFNGVAAWFQDWFSNEYCVEKNIKYDECVIKCEEAPGWFVLNENKVFAYHPDGIITVDLPDDQGRLVWLIKITCPLSKRDYDTQADAPIFGEHSVAGVEGLKPMPSNCFADVNLGMKVMNIQSTFFAVWTQMHAEGTKESVQVQIMERDDDFIETMIADANDYFWEDYIPRLRQLQDDVEQARSMLTADAQAYFNGSAPHHDHYQVKWFTIMTS